MPTRRGAQPTSANRGQDPDSVQAAVGSQKHRVTVPTTGSAKTLSSAGGYRLISGREGPVPSASEIHEADGCKRKITLVKFFGVDGKFLVGTFFVAVTVEVHLLIPRP